jgi:DNA-binding response OmpR family regulator/AraC-like DNA-binding protein
MAQTAASGWRDFNFDCRMICLRFILARPVKQFSGSPPTVLAVDDDPAVRESLGMTLEEHCRVLLAADGVEALEKLRLQPVDVVLLDLLMPRMDGREALVQIHARHPRTPVIMVTAVDDVSTIVECVKLGACDYIKKPWDEEGLVARVHAATRERRDEPGVLLVSDDVAALAPLHLALERQIRVVETTVVSALRSTFRPMAVVLDERGARMRPSGCRLQERFPGAPLVLMKTMNAVLTELAGHGVISYGGLNTTVTAAVDFIAGHYAEPLSVTAVASAVSLSASRLAHVFPEATGLTVMDYVTRLRVNIARRLLLETSDTLDKIAARLGFADASNFSRTFKGIDGIAPGEFRRSKPSY